MENKISGGVRRSHSLHIEKNGEQNKVTVSGVQSVVNMNEKIAVLQLDAAVLSLRGSGITLNKLSVEDGNLSLEAQNIESVQYSGKGSPILKRLFK